MPSVAISGVRVVETHWIPLSDGRNLAARLFLPEDSDRNAVPLILEYLPYRRRDGTRTGDEEMHVFFAKHGYGCARVDIAGTGDSDGVLDGEYVEREQRDALEILDHLCAQPWCTGVAGMIGISWGGINALQVAALKPPQLKAIVTACSTDDRYACDAHYNGGLLINDNFAWGGALFCYGALPPDPAVVGEDNWRRIWRSRLDNHKNYAAEWLKHQRRDAFWKRGSVCEDFSSIECAVLAVGGYLDGYTQTIFSLVENLTAPAKGICGPWGHKEPQSGVPGPAIGYLQECLDWFDHWLKDIENGADGAPDMRLYLMDHVTPRSHTTVRPGRWLGFPQWPAKQIGGKVYWLNRKGTLGETPDITGDRPTLCSPLTTGVQGQEWCPFGQGRISAEGARDQRPDDGGSLCFDSDVMTEDLALAGISKITLRVASDKPQAQLCVRLNDLAPDGTSALITFALLNLSHRASNEFPTPLSPGRFEDVNLAFKPVAQVIPAGHRLRVAISSSYWPMTWPSPESATLTHDLTGCRLDLSVLASEDGLAQITFEEALWAQPGPVTIIEPGRHLRSLTTDIPTERTELAVMSDDGHFVLEETGTEITSWRRKIYEIGAHDPTSCVTRVTCHREYSRPDWNARIDCEISIRCDFDNFYASGWIIASERGETIVKRSYDEVIPRDFL